MEYIPTRRIIEGFKWGILDGVDPNFKNFVCAGVLHTSQAGKFGCPIQDQTYVQAPSGCSKFFCSRKGHDTLGGKYRLLVRILGDEPTAYLLSAFPDAPIAFPAPLPRKHLFGVSRRRSVNRS